MTDVIVDRLLGKAPEDDGVTGAVLDGQAPSALASAPALKGDPAGVDGPPRLPGIAL